MRITRLLLLLPFLFLSCSVPSYVFTNPAQAGLSFKEGKWLLNSIDGNNDVNNMIYKKAVEDFSGFVGTRLSETGNTNGLLLGAKIPLNPSQKQITDLYKGTKFDYFINIKTNMVKDNLAAVSLNVSHMSDNRQNMSTVTLEVYDLKNGMVIYSQTAQGSAHKPTDSTSDVHLVKSSQGLVLGCYNRLIKDIKKKSS